MATRKIKAIAVIKTDPIDGSFLDLELYGNLKHLQEIALPNISYGRIWSAIKEKGYFKITGKAGENDLAWTNNVDITVMPKELNRGERKME